MRASAKPIPAAKASRTHRAVGLRASKGCAAACEAMPAEGSSVEFLAAYRKKSGVPYETAAPPRAYRLYLNGSAPPPRAPNRHLTGPSPRPARSSMPLEPAPARGVFLFQNNVLVGPRRGAGKPANLSTLRLEYVARCHVVIPDAANAI